MVVNADDRLNKKQGHCNRPNERMAVHIIGVKLQKDSSPALASYSLQRLILFFFCFLLNAYIGILGWQLGTPHDA